MYSVLAGFNLQSMYPSIEIQIIAIWVDWYQIILSGVEGKGGTISKLGSIRKGNQVTSYPSCSLLKMP